MLPKMAHWLLVFCLFYCQTSLSIADNGTDDYLEPGSVNCKPGLLLPVWEPTTNLALGDIIARGMVYFVLMVYFFVGVSIIADKFMAAIEVITSQEREVTIKKPNTEPQRMRVRIWNETVSNLTLMALGSSAPEILLSIIEVYAQDFHAGELGPSTIVGSAAFNMFVIIAICVSCVSSEYKKIKHLRVFCVTMIWSVFAYIWLCYILTWSSYGVIEIWEGLVTFMMFPATVLTAYIADRRLLIYKYLNKNYRVNKHGVIVGTEGEDVELAQTTFHNNITHNGFRVFEEADEEAREFEEHRREYMQVIREIRKKHPSATMTEMEVLARNEIMNRGPKSRAFYRLQATKKLTGNSIFSRRRVEKSGEEIVKPISSNKNENVMKIFFNPGHYTVFENVGQFAVTVSREGNLNHSICVDFKTEDGTANAGSDYEPVEGTLIFRTGEAHKQVYINVIDDDVFEEDEHFYVVLSNPRYLSQDANNNGNLNNITPNKLPQLQLSTPALATVMILDDDHSGVFSFAEGQYEISESSGEYHLKVCRFSGARGRVILPYKTVEGTAKDSHEFEMTSGQIVFDDNETTQYIPINIIDNESYEKDVIFYVELGEPIREEDLHNDANDQEAQIVNANNEIALLGKPKLGELYKCQVRIKESKEFKNMVDKLISKANSSIMIGSTSWKEQFIEAITVSTGDDDEDGDGEPRMPSCSDYVMHFFTLFWKLLFAFVPPTDYMNGWLCFISSIMVIGILTAMIGDLASHFGCTSGIKDSVTAISFVALGTSVPDTFASKVAAQNDKYADSSIGNVTGSNAVNVFLGIGIAWTLAAIVRAYRGERFEIDPGSLTYSVTLFCFAAAICCAVLMFRRRLGGELGGPMKYRLPTTLLFVSLWLFYLLMSCLEAYKVIPGF